ncbi:MAG: hypothetical protein ACYDAG_06195 [Chloroflexota bacterium]
MFGPWRIALVALAFVLLPVFGSQTARAGDASAGLSVWAFTRPGDTLGFQGHSSNGASNVVSWAQSPASTPGSGSIRLDYTGSQGFNTSVMTSSIPAIGWGQVVTITADVYVPASVTIPRLGFGIQVDGPPAGKVDVPIHLLGLRGGWNRASWPVHPGQLAGRHTFGFVLDTDVAMPAPLYVANIRAITPSLTVNANDVISSFDPSTLWGNNVAYYYPPAFFTDPRTAQLARDAGFTFFRIPGGLNSDVYHWNGNGVRRPDGSIDPNARRPDGTWRIDYSAWAPGFQVKGEGITGDPMASSHPVFASANAYDHSPPVDVNQLAHWIMGLGPSARMMVDVNVGTGSPLVATGPNFTLQESDVARGAQEAAQWVRYFNVVRGLHVKYWEVGNELNPFGAEMGAHIRDSSAQGWHWITAADYATIFRAYASAMKAVDPTIKLCGPVGYVNAPADGTGQGNWLQTFLKDAGDVVDVVDIHFYDSGRTRAEYLAVPPNLGSQVGTIRGWIQRYAPQRAGQIGVGISEWGDYNNLYPIGDGLFAADLMGEMAKLGLTFGNAWDIGNMIPDNGAIVPRFGFSSAKHDSGGWVTVPANGATNAVSWTADPSVTRPGGTSMAVGYHGSTGDNAALTHSAAGVDWSGVDSIRADVFIPRVPGNDAVSFWLRIVKADGTVDDSYRDQPQSTIWGQWNRVLFPVDPAKLAGARQIDIVMSSPVPVATPLYFGQIETQRTLWQPNGRYWAAYMYHHYFSNTLVRSSIGRVSRDRLAAYASRAPDGTMYLMVINKDPLSDVGIPISIQGYHPAPYAEATTWGQSNYVWSLSRGSATRDAPPTTRVVGSGSQFSYVFPRDSITAIKLYPG